MRVDMRLLRHLRAYSGVVLNDALYFYAAYGGLLRMDLKNGKMEYLDFPPIFENTTAQLHHFLVRNRGEIYQINSYNGQITGLDNSVVGSLKEMNEVASVPLFAQSYGSYIYCLLNNGMLFTDIDIRSGEYNFFDLRKIIPCKIEGYSIAYGGLHGEKIYAFPWVGRTMVIYEIRQAELKQYSFPRSIGICKHVATRDDKIYVLNNNNQIYYWEPQNEHVNKIWDEAYVSTKESRKDSCGRIHLCGSKLIILPSQNGTDIKILDVISGDTNTYRDYPPDFQYIMGDPYKFVRYVETESEIIYPMRSANYILKIDRYTGELRWVKPRPPMVEDILAHFQPNKANIYEEIFPLKLYHTLVKGSAVRYLHTGIGEKIWDFLK